MATFILTWNPTKWEFDQAEYDSYVAATRRGDFVEAGWSTGGRTGGIEPGDRAFLLRQHDHRGIVAGGGFTSEVWEDAHWDGSGRVANFADAMWETFLITEERLPVELLHAKVDAAWDRMQGSGVRLRDHAADDLEELWLDHLEKIGRTLQ